MTEVAEDGGTSATLAGRLGLRSSIALRDLLLAGLTMSSGAADAISFIVLGKVFTAFMTGNLVFLGLSLTDAGGPDVVPVGVSLLAFSAGVMLARWIVADADANVAWPPAVSGVLGVTLVAQAGFWVVWMAVSGHPSAVEVDLLVALYALAMGAQSGAVLKLGVPAVFTTAATATIIVLVSDFAAGGSRRAEMPRLERVVAALIIGAAAGGVLLTHARLYAPVLPIVVTAAVIVVASAARRPGTPRA